MSLRRETIHRMTRRCLGWDYRQPAIYMITLVQADRRRPLLGRLVVDEASSPEEVRAHVDPTALGEAILEHWKRIGEFTPEIKPLLCQIMPDHLHAILEVRRPMDRPLGNAIGGFKTGCEKLYRKLALPLQDKALPAQDRALPAQNRALPAQERDPLAHDKRLVPCPGRKPRVSKLFSEGFQDTILFHEGQLDNMFGYLRDNPRRLAVKRLFPDLFRVVGRLKVAFRPAAGVSGTGQGASGTGQGACSVPGAQAPGYGFFSALGNRFLLDRPLLQVQVSRRDFAYRREPKPGGGTKITRDASGEPVIALASPAFVEKRDTLLAAARRGMVLLSPCVSDGERKVAREAMATGLPLVALRNKGFSVVQKPSGRHFDACSEGRLLLLAPAAWPYTPAEKPMTRRDALALNRLCQWLAGPGAAEIRYRGLVPSEPDRAAQEAVCFVPGAQVPGFNPANMP